MNIENYSVIIEYEGRIICRGKMINTKINNTKQFDLLFITIDERYFFNTKHKDVKVTYVEEELPSYLDLEGIKITPWIECRDNPNELVYEEHDKEELDKEVVPLLQALNKIQGLRTTGSCSGHGKCTLWVDIMFEDYASLVIMTKLINSRFYDSWCLRTEKSLRTKNNMVQLRLESKNIGEIAYLTANSLAECLESITD